MTNADKDSVYRESIRKFLIDALGNSVFFDKTFIDPASFEAPPPCWFVADIGGLDAINGRFEPSLRIFCCTRQDPEQIVMSQKVDLVRAALRDDAMPDGCRRIPAVLWNAATEAYDTIGAMLVETKNPSDSGNMSAPDHSNYRILTYRLVWVANG
ncbi:MAG: hypothetical protein WC343_11625 [Bacilli bacterium]|jgi:hypothetical protein